MDQLALNVWEGLHPQYAPYITFAITVAAGLAVIMPPPTQAGWKSKAWYGISYRGVQWVALNFRHARNANDPIAIQAARDTINNAPTASVG